MGEVTQPVKITLQSPLSCKVTQKLGWGGELALPEA